MGNPEAGLARNGQKFQHQRSPTVQWNHTNQSSANDQSTVNQCPINQVSMKLLGFSFGRQKPATVDGIKPLHWYWNTVDKVNLFFEARHGAAPGIACGFPAKFYQASYVPCTSEAEIFAKLIKGKHVLYINHVNKTLSERRLLDRPKEPGCSTNHFHLSYLGSHLASAS